MSGIKRGSTNYSLLVGLKKPVGITSHDCVSRVRRIFGEKRVGHAGTLDPFASGILPVMIGPATKLMPYFNCHEKQYIAGIKFGYSTVTDDSTGEILSSVKPDERLFDEEFARETLKSFLGKHMQMPPRYCAIKVGGKKSYEAARSGLELELREREVSITQANLLRIETDYDGNCEPVWFVDFIVSSGTYIRSIARDIGESVGIPAHLRSLSRMKVSNISFEECFSIEELESVKASAYIDPVQALGEIPVIVDDFIKNKISNGVPLSVDDITKLSDVFDGDGHDIYSRKLFLCTDSQLLGIYTYNEKKDLFVPECIFSIGVSRGVCDN